MRSALGREKSRPRVSVESVSSAGDGRPSLRGTQTRTRADVPAGLVSRARSGDSQALEDLLRILAPQLRRAAGFALGAKNPEVEDCLQEILVAVTTALPSLRDERSIVYFAIKIAIRCARLARRRHRHERQNEDRAMQLEEPLLLTPDAPDDRALRAERSAAVQRLLDQLPDPQADTFRLRILHGRSMSEVARATGAPLNTVRSRLRLAREALRVRISGDAILLDLLTDSLPALLPAADS